MKKSISKLKYLVGLILIAGIFACEGPEGPQGPAGTNGIDGVDGVDGTDGADGNANVTTVNLSASSVVWTLGSYLGRDANMFSFTAAEVTQDVMDHGVVLGFCFFSTDWWSLPMTWESTGGTSRQYILHSYDLNTITLWAYQSSGVLTPSPSILSQYRFLCITDNTVTKSASSGSEIIERLTNLGVDVNDYYEVMDYFGLEY